MELKFAPASPLRFTENICNIPTVLGPYLGYSLDTMVRKQDETNEGLNVVA
jgi:hypothetical protein